MSRTFASLKSIVTSKLHKADGTFTTADLDRMMNEALVMLNLKLDFPEAMTTATLSPRLFDDVFTYAAPSDMKGDAVLAIRPFTEIPSDRRQTELMRQQPSEFTRETLWTDSEGRYAVEYDRGISTKKIRIAGRVSDKAVNRTLHACNTFDGNGTWTADGTTDATNVATDAVNYFEGSGSVRFDVDVSQSAGNTATIYNADMASVDTSDSNDPYLFIYVFIPDVTNVTGVNISYGSDTSATPSTKANYYTFAATTQFGGDALVTGKNLIGIQKSSATETGTVDDAAITYLEVELTYSASQTDMSNVRIDGIILRDGELHEIRYFTKNLVDSNAGVSQETFQADDDVLILNEEGELLFTEFAAGHLASNIREFSSAKIYMNNAEMAISEYRTRYPSERKLVQKSYYFS